MTVIYYVHTMNKQNIHVRLGKINIKNIKREMCIISNNIRIATWLTDNTYATFFQYLLI